MMPYKTGTVRVTSPFGMRTIDGVPDNHKGIDLVGTDKTIVAVLPGKVLFSRQILDKNNRTWEWGNYVCIQSDDGTLSYYCHLASRAVRAGDRVKVGDIIGREGSTGKSTGSHLHFEVRRPDGVSVDPTMALGIPNRIGSHDVLTDADRVCRKAGLEAQTKAYLDRYKYAPDLWRKLWEAMR
jgi:murein DD-endopeptidase MepM/ murein hydrolase activator NlpD